MRKPDLKTNIKASEEGLKDLSYDQAEKLGWFGTEIRLNYQHKNRQQ